MINGPQIERQYKDCIIKISRINPSDLSIDDVQLFIDTAYAHAESIKLEAGMQGSHSDNGAGRLREKALSFQKGFHLGLKRRSQLGDENRIRLGDLPDFLTTYYDEKSIEERRKLYQELKLEFGNE